MTTAAADLRYPIGKFTAPGELTATARTRHIEEIAAAPAALLRAVTGLSDEQLGTPYRPEGWTARQVVHHLADSHMNAYCRFRLALTEDAPAIRPYDEVKWAELPDAKSGATELSLPLLGALHTRWVRLLSAMTAADFRRTVFHPEHDRTFTLDDLLSSYAWHGRHHVAHVTSLRERNRW